MSNRTLFRSGSPFAILDHQRQLLAESPGVPEFNAVLAQHGLPRLTAGQIDVLQVNLGKLCNQTCTHCHVDAGPDRRESMSESVVEACLSVLERSSISTLDITGGAPEMNPHFRRLVRRARALDRSVIDRCNLTILVAPGFTDLPEFLADHEVEIVASLPCYLPENTDRQRGEGVFEHSLAALRRLNQLGYGTETPERRLTLVFNPQGTNLPPNQASLEHAYRRELLDRYGITFDRLYTITNVPISRFLADLWARGELSSYLQTLLAAFQPATVEGLMCRHTISVDWQGRLYDCDFNQMLDLPITATAVPTVFTWDPDQLQGRTIQTGRHCFACTAGSGSGCSGAIVRTTTQPAATG